MLTCDEYARIVNIYTRILVIDPIQSILLFKRFYDRCEECFLEYCVCNPNVNPHRLLKKKFLNRT